MWFTSQITAKAADGSCRSLVWMRMNGICAWETGI